MAICHVRREDLELTGRLVGRALKRSAELRRQHGVVHEARVDVRLHMLFWRLADRWWRVGTDGVTVALRLTLVLADLGAARRPAITGKDIVTTELAFNHSPPTFAGMGDRARRGIRGA